MAPGGWFTESINPHVLLHLIFKYFILCVYFILAVQAGSPGAKYAKVVTQISALVLPDSSGVINLVYR